MGAHGPTLHTQATAATIRCGRARLTLLFRRQAIHLICYLRIPATQPCLTTAFRRTSCPIPSLRLARTLDPPSILTLPFTTLILLRQWHIRTCSHRRPRATRLRLQVIQDTPTAWPGTHSPICLHTSTLAHCRTSGSLRQGTPCLLQQRSKRTSRRYRRPRLWIESRR